jgi:hypothetical protein
MRMAEKLRVTTQRVSEEEDNLIKPTTWRYTNNTIG